MALFLVQHGKSLAKDVDPDQGLSEEGIQEVKRIADVAKNYHVRVSTIAHSGKKRARQTAELFAAALLPASEPVERAGMKPLDDVVAFSNGLKPTPNAMFVGHLPFMARLTSFLITGSQTPPVIKFQNGGIVCLDHTIDLKAWVIKWALMPHID